MTERAAARLATLLVALAACAAVGRFVAAHYYSLYDDGFIYLRYVQQLHAGCGLRFNCHDARVEGVTSPLFLGLLALGSALSSRWLTLAQVLCALPLAAAIALAARAAAGSREVPVAQRAAGALAVLAVLALDDYALLNSVTGLETALGAALVTGAYLAARSERYVAAGWCAGLAFLVRPEAGILVAALPVMPGARRAGVLGPAWGIVLGATALRLALFHDVVPNTFWVKSGGSSAHLALGVAYLGRTLRDFPAVLLVLLAPFAPRAGLRRAGAWRRPA